MSHADYVLCRIVRALFFTAHMFIHVLLCSLLFFVLCGGIGLLGLCRLGLFVRVINCNCSYNVRFNTNHQLISCHIPNWSAKGFVIYHYSINPNSI